MTFRETEFIFRTRRTMDSETYVAWELATQKPSKKPSPLRVVAFLAIAVAMLFWRFTAGLGVLLLVFALVGACMPRMIARAARQRFAWMEHLHGEVEYQVSHAGLRFRSARLDAFAPWESVARHRLDDEHLHVWCSGMPPLVLPREELERAGLASEVLERVLDAEAAAVARASARLAI